MKLSPPSLLRCGWHNDHGSLTGLVSGMCVRAAPLERWRRVARRALSLSRRARARVDGTNIIWARRRYIDARDGRPLASSPDASAGLYIRDRAGALHHAKFGPDELAFQIGEAAQIHTGGVLQATPHAVRGCRASHAAGGGGDAAGGGAPPARCVSREAFAVFMEPCWDEGMCVPLGVDPEVALQRPAAKRALPPKVPPLATRWDNSMSFGDFSEKTLNAYH